MAETPDPKRCPHDGGYCHHMCGPTEKCLREEGEMVLTVPHHGYPLPGHEPDFPEDPELAEEVDALFTENVICVHRGNLVEALLKPLPEPSNALFAEDPGYEEERSALSQSLIDQHASNRRDQLIRRSEAERRNALEGLTNGELQFISVDKDVEERPIVVTPGEIWPPRSGLEDAVKKIKMALPTVEEAGARLHEASRIMSGGLRSYPGYRQNPSAQEAAEGLFEEVCVGFEGGGPRPRPTVTRPPSHPPEGAIKPPPPPRPQALAEPQAVTVPDDLPSLEAMARGDSWESVFNQLGMSPKEAGNIIEGLQAEVALLKRQERKSLGMINEANGNAGYHKSMYEQLRARKSLWERIVSSLTKD